MIIILQVLGDKGRLPGKRPNEVIMTKFFTFVKSFYCRDSTLTLASVAGVELNGNSEAAVA